MGWSVQSDHPLIPKTGGIKMNKNYEKILVAFGEWSTGEYPSVQDFKTKGRLIAQTTAYRGCIPGGYNVGTDWKLYQLEDGRYLLWWNDWTTYGNHQNAADYTILDTLPVPDAMYEGRIFYDSQPVPSELIDEAEAMLML